MVQVANRQVVVDPRAVERMEAMAEAQWQERLKTWPRPCVICFAEAGERCMTKTGGRAVRHKGR